MTRTRALAAVGVPFLVLLVLVFLSPAAVALEPAGVIRAHVENSVPFLPQLDVTPFHGPGLTIAPDPDARKCTRPELSACAAQCGGRVLMCSVGSAPDGVMTMDCVCKGRPDPGLQVQNSSVQRGMLAAL